MFCLERGMSTPKGGRPSGGGEARGTAQVRTFGDIGEMIRDLCEVLNVASAQLLDPIIRPEIEALHEHHRPAIERVKAARAEYEKARDDATKQAAERPPDAKPQRKKG